MKQVLLVGVVVVAFALRFYLEYHKESTKQTQIAVLVLGGTGQQGKGCIEYLQKENSRNSSVRYKIRTLTRNTNSDSAKELINLGVEVFPGEITDADLFATALEGIDAVFGMTFSDFEGGKEFSHGKILGDAVKAANVKQFIFSGGEQTNISFLDVKFEIEQYVRALNIPFTVYLHTVFFYENLVNKKGDKRVGSQDDGVIRFSSPLPQDLKIPMISAMDIGRIAGVAIAHPERFKNGMSFPIAGDIVNPLEFVESFTNVSSLQAHYTAIPLEVFEQKPIPGAKAIADMYRWYIQKGHHRDISKVREVFPEVQNLNDWMKTVGVDYILSQMK